MRTFALSVALSALLPAAVAQTFSPISPVAFDTAGPVIRAHAEALKPFTVAGERGVLLGQQDGSFEAWVLPVKLLSHLTIEASIQDYTVPIDVNAQASEIEVRPDRTIITYAHIGFTVRQIMFSPDAAPPGTGPVVLFEFDCLHPTDFTFRFTPDLRLMWPARSEGIPGVEWVAPGKDPHSEPGGFYVLHSDYPDLAAAVTIPGARAGILAPYQERPQVHPVELKLHIDPEKDRGRLYPLLMAAGINTQSAQTSALGATLENLNRSIAQAYAAHAAGYAKLLKDSVSIETRDKSLNEAFEWAKVSIEQLKARPVNTDETALVAGYYASGDSARPGFGWFFGRDALYTLYAVNGYGDFALAKSELEFLMRRQRADGKIMHEFSQTAPLINWQQFPYMYAAADATPLFLLAVTDYVRASGDTDFLSTHRAEIEKAWTFETSHAEANGIYSNAQGTGWVESWPGGMPHQEVYLALLDQQASAAMGSLEDVLGNSAAAASARTRAASIAKTINAEFGNGEKGCYAFSRASDGTLDRTTTVYPALAWWSDLAGTTGHGGSILEKGDECLAQLSEHALNTDWGLRDVSNTEKIYDGMSYHQGSVWPLFTGWAALAEYRGRQPLAGYQMLMENANLTKAQDLGAVTELLSGDFFIPFGRSTSHQLWSSAMVITPALRGLFGISVDAQTKTITVNPQLPASWDQAQVLRIPTPDGPASFKFQRAAAAMEVTPTVPQGWHVRSDIAGASTGAAGDSKSRKHAQISAAQGLRIPLPPVQIDVQDPTPNLADAATEFAPGEPPLPGARTRKFRVLRSEYGEHTLKLTLEGIAGSEGVVQLLRHGNFVPQVHLASSGGEATLALRGCDAKPEACASYPLVLRFPPGDGWAKMDVTLTW